jgi:hypothetical protein
MYSVVGKILYMNWSYKASVGGTGGPLTSYFYKLPSGYTTSSISNLVTPYVGSGGGTLIGTGHTTQNTNPIFIFYTTSGTTPHMYFVGKTTATTYIVQSDTYVPYTVGSLNIAFEAAIPLA